MFERAVFRSCEGWELKAIMYLRRGGDLLSGAGNPPQYSLLQYGSSKISQTV